MPPIIVLSLLASCVVYYCTSLALLGERKKREPNNSQIIKKMKSWMIEGR